MKRTKSEILSQLKVILKDDTSDEAVSLLEDITDTLDDTDTDVLEDYKKRVEELETRVKETEDFWRSKYTDRFFSTDPLPSGKSTVEETILPPEEETPDEHTKETFDELFTKGDK